MSSQTSYTFVPATEFCYATKVRTDSLKKMRQLKAGAMTYVIKQECTNVDLKCCTSWGTIGRSDLNELLHKSDCGDAQHCQYLRDEAKPNKGLIVAIAVILFFCLFAGFFAW